MTLEKAQSITSIFQGHKDCLYGKSQESAVQSPCRGLLGTPFPNHN